MKRLLVISLSLVILPLAALGYHGLLVTDPDDQAEALFDFLTGLGYTVTVARDYPDAPGMGAYDFVVCRKGSLEGLAPTFEAYLAAGAGCSSGPASPGIWGCPSGSG